MLANYMEIRQQIPSSLNTLFMVGILMIVLIFNAAPAIAAEANKNDTHLYGSWTELMYAAWRGQTAAVNRGGMVGGVGET